MTVTSTNYSSLDEVWGESFNGSSRPKKEKKKKVHDPICELYEMGNNNGYSENDLVSYANNYFEKYDKSKYQKSMNDDNSVLPREKPMRHVDISADKRNYDVSDEDEEVQRPITPQKYAMKKEYVHNTPRTMKQQHTFDDEEESQNTGFAFIDLLLYIVSGIILIFVMEQFVKIGLLLQ